MREGRLCSLTILVIKFDCKYFSQNLHTITVAMQIVLKEFVQEGILSGQCNAPCLFWHCSTNQIDEIEHNTSKTVRHSFWGNHHTVAHLNRVTREKDSKSEPVLN